jgi:hypothetical protein
MMKIVVRTTGKGEAGDLPLPRLISREWKAHYFGLFPPASMWSSTLSHIVEALGLLLSHVCDIRQFEELRSSPISFLPKPDSSGMLFL